MLFCWRCSKQYLREFQKSFQANIFLIQMYSIIHISYIFSLFFFLSFSLTLSAGWQQLSKNCYGHHANNAAYPNKADYAIGMIYGLPTSGAQGMANGIVAFTWNGYQRPRRRSHRHCWKEKRKTRKVSICQRIKKD